MRAYTILCIAITTAIPAVTIADTHPIELEWGSSVPGRKWILSITHTNARLSHIEHTWHSSADYTVITNHLVDRQLTDTQFRALSDNIQISGIYTVSDHISNVPILPIHAVTSDGEAIEIRRSRWDGWYISFKHGHVQKTMRNGYDNAYLSLCKAVEMIDPIIKQEISVAADWLVREVTRVAEINPGTLDEDMHYEYPNQPMQPTADTRARDFEEGKP